MQYFTYFDIIFISIFVTSSSSIYATYTLSYTNTQSTSIYINIQFTINKITNLDLNGTQTFIIPRSVPSGYNLELYDMYVDNLKAKSLSGNDIIITKESTGGPRWTLECSSNETLSSISYSIDLTKHEQGILSAGDASKIRQGRYIGILGYSVYGYLEQMDKKENFPIMLIVHSPSDWPIHLTLSSNDRLPHEQVYGTTYGIAKNYYHLADSQVYMGPNISFTYISIPYDELYPHKTTKFDQEHTKTAVSFYVIVYTEDSYDLDINMVANLSTQAMKNLLLYYHSLPFLFYTVGIEMIKPLDEQHSYGFSMEHLYSCTIDIQYGSGINKNSTQEQIKRFQYNIAHHIQHAWLPKRLFSNYYYPYTFELTPVINTIWFNEGFGQYVAMDAMANVLSKNESYEYRNYFIKNRFEYYFNLAPLFIKQMPLEYLSMIASSSYSTDFRTGSNLFARGALMAKDMDELIKSKTQQQKSLHDGIIYMMKWSESNSYTIPFTMEQFPEFFMNATNVNITSVLDKWLQ